MRINHPAEQNHATDLLVARRLVPIVNFLIGVFDPAIVAKGPGSAVGLPVAIGLGQVDGEMAHIFRDGGHLIPISAKVKMIIFKRRAHFALAKDQVRIITMGVGVDGDGITILRANG